MEIKENESGLFKKWCLRLSELFSVFRRSDLKQELSKAEAHVGWERKRTERILRRYDVLERKCAALSTEADGLRSRLYVAEQQAEAFKGAAKALCAAVEAAEDLKHFYQAIAPCLDYGGFLLFNAAQEITGFSLSREYPFEDACGCFEFLDGVELLRYLIASEFGAVTWEFVPDSGCKKAVLGEVDESTPSYREFERQLYKRVLERLGLRTATPALTRQT